MACSQNKISHDPAKMLDESFERIPESWRYSMQLIRPMDGLNLCHIRGQPGADWAFRSEGGPNLTIGLLLEGYMEAGIEGGTDFCLKAGEAVLMGVGASVSGWNVLSPRRNIHLLNINLSPQALLGLTGLQIGNMLNILRESRCSLAHVDVGMARLPVSSILHRIVADITRCGCLDKQANKVLMCAKVAECLAVILNCCTLTYVRPHILRTTPCERPKLLRARALVPSLASAVGMNEKRLQAGFQTMYGCSVHTCLTRTRLDMSKAMLTSGHSVTDTAYAVGFANISHFSKVFRRDTGVSPRNWVQK